MKVLLLIHCYNKQMEFSDQLTVVSKISNYEMLGHIVNILGDINEVVNWEKIEEPDLPDRRKIKHCIMDILKQFNDVIGLITPLNKAYSKLRVMQASIF